MRGEGKRFAPPACPAEAAQAVAKDDGPEPLEDSPVLLAWRGDEREGDDSAVQDRLWLVIADAFEERPEELVAAHAVIRPNAQARQVDERLERSLGGGHAGSAAACGVDVELPPAQIAGEAWHAVVAGDQGRGVQGLRRPEVRRRPRALPARRAG